MSRSQSRTTKRPSQAKRKSCLSRYSWPSWWYLGVWITKNGSAIRNSKTRFEPDPFLDIMVVICRQSILWNSRTGSCKSDDKIARAHEKDNYLWFTIRTSLCMFISFFYSIPVSLMLSLISGFCSLQYIFPPYRQDLVGALPVPVVPDKAM